MSLAKQLRPFPDLADERADIERQMLLWRTEAALLACSMEAIAFALRVDACQIQFKGDLIVFDGRSYDLALVNVNLARIRKVVCNLKVLLAQRKQFQAQEKQIR
jgi:hypothetical protein